MKLQDLKAMTPEQREAAIAELAQASMGPSGEQLGPLQARLRELEVKYEMTTQEMLEKAARGELRDTADFSRWKVLARGLGAALVYHMEMAEAAQIKSTLGVGCLLQSRPDCLGIELGDLADPFIEQRVSVGLTDGSYWEARPTVRGWKWKVVSGPQDGD